MKKPARIPAIKMIKVKSSNIEAVGYNEESFQLFVEFKATDRSPAKTFVYYDVNLEEYENLMTAESVGKVFHSTIKAVKEGCLHESEPEPAKESNGWISVDDKLPESRSEVLFYVKELDQIELGKYNDSTGKWIKPHSDVYFMNGIGWVTHWMPLPETPTT